MPRGQYDRATPRLVEMVMTFFSKLPREELANTDHDAEAGKVGVKDSLRVLGSNVVKQCRRAVLVGIEPHAYSTEELKAELANFPVKTQSILKAERAPQNDAAAMALWRERGTSKVLTNIRNNAAVPDIRIAPAPMQSSVISELRENYVPRLVMYNVTRLVLERASLESKDWFAKVTRVVEESYPLGPIEPVGIRIQC